MSLLLREEIIENYNKPKNNIIPVDYNYKNNLENSNCGDEITVYLKVENNIIIDIGYEVTGCALTIAAASIISEEIKMSKIDDVQKIDNTYLQDIFGQDFTSSRQKCISLFLDAIKGIDLAERTVD